MIVLKVRKVPVETAIALVARAAGIDPGAALEMSGIAFAKAIEAAKRRRAN